jgi:hypothetical protein
MSYASSLKSFATAGKSNILAKSKGVLPFLSATLTATPISVTNHSTTLKRSSLGPQHAECKAVSPVMAL